MAKKICTQNAPAAIGPYSQAMWAGNTLYISGQLGLDPKNLDFVSDSVVYQAHQALVNIKAILLEAGLEISDIVKTTVFLSDINDFGDINNVYSIFFGDHKPARSAIQAAALPKGAKIEIEVIACQTT